MTSWRFDPVKGEYVSIDQAPHAGTGEISAMDQFNSKTILILGATGFVGKVLLAMLLDRFPKLKHLVIQVRRKKNVSGKQRFLSDVLESPPLRTVVDRLGLESILKRTSIIEGDLSTPMCGMPAEQLAALTDKVTSSSMRRVWSSSILR